MKCLWGQLLACMMAMFAVSSACAQYAPQNFAPNSQWEIFSGMSYGARENIDGTGTIAPITLTGNSTGSNLVVLRHSGIPGDVKLGDLVKLQGAALDPVLTKAPMRIWAFGPGSLTVRPAVGAAPAISGKGVAQPVNIGMAASLNTGDAADGWKKPVGLMVWREDNYQNLPSKNPLTSGHYALGVQKDVDADEYVETITDAARYRGKTIAFGITGYHKVRAGAPAWRVYIKSSSGAAESALATSAGGYQWLETSYLVPNTATSLSVGVRLLGRARDTYYFAEPVLTVGTAIGPGNYTRPREIFTPVVHISPPQWINAEIKFPTRADPNGTYRNTFDIYAETAGAVAPSVRHAFGQIEGINTGAVQVNTGVIRAIAFFDQPIPPTKGGSFLPQYVAGVKSFASLDMPLDHNGESVYYSGMPGDVWTNVSMEFDWFILE